MVYAILCSLFSLHCQIDKQCVCLLFGFKGNSSFVRVAVVIWIKVSVLINFVGVVSYVSNFSIMDVNNTFQFEQYVAQAKRNLQQMYSWDLTEWRNNEQENSQAHKFIKSTRFWFQNLKDVESETALVVTLFKAFNYIDISPKEIILQMLNFISPKDFKGFVTPRNSHFLILYFNGKEARDKVVEGLDSVDDFIVINNTWITQPVFIKANITWISMQVSTDEIIQYFKPYFTILMMEMEMMEIMDGMSFPTGKYNIEISLKRNVTPDIIPHVFTIRGHDGMLVMPGRKPYCYSCSCPGHLSKNCPVPFCNKCRLNLPKGHSCVKPKKILTYAKVLVRARQEYQKALEEREENDVSDQQSMNGYVNRSLLAQSPSLNDSKISNGVNGKVVLTGGSSQVDVDSEIIVDDSVSNVPTYMDSELSNIKRKADTDTDDSHEEVCLKVNKTKSGYGAKVGKIVSDENKFDNIFNK